MKELKTENNKPENPGIFDFRSMSENELRVNLGALRECEPNMISPESAKVSLEAVKKSGVTGGNQAYFLTVQKRALGVIETLCEPVNLNEILADVIANWREDLSE